ncbi:MAG: SpoIIE family protein phosphatase [Scytolyngbya sp. HA4215-MV1]|nr:SpoIIE family protein phosphatase [Scytolyngbya sp. HA4215-MV1]
MSLILIIDDDPIIRVVLQRSLQGQQYEVITASTGEEGIAKAKQFRPALIICDWVMPRIDGLEVCRQIKAYPELSTTFFILLTSRVALEDRIRGLDTGADDFLSKPVEMSELKARVRAGLRLHQVTRDLQNQKQKLESELSEAAEYLRSLLPPPLTGTITIDARFIPSQQLGGDCFDYYWLDPDYLAIYLLDVSGHGLGAALPSVSILNLLRSQSLPDVNFYQPDAVLRALNEIFQMSDQNNRYFTIWYGVYNQTKRQLVYASAGHPPAVLIPGATHQPTPCKLLKSPDIPVGIFPDSKFGYYRCEIEKASTLYIFSDGAYEISCPDDRIWGLEAFIQLLSEHWQSRKFNLDEILQQIQAINGNDTFEDDLSLLQINFD